MNVQLVIKYVFMTTLKETARSIAFGIAFVTVVVSLFIPLPYSLDIVALVVVGILGFLPLP